MFAKNITYLQGTTWVSTPDTECQMMGDVLSFETLGNDICHNFPLSILKDDGKSNG